MTVKSPTLCVQLSHCCGKLLQTPSAFSAYLRAGAFASLRQFWHRLPILPWIGSAIIHAAGKVPLDRLPTAHHAGKCALQLDLVPGGAQLVTNILCEAILHI